MRKPPPPSRWRIFPSCCRDDWVKGRERNVAMDVYIDGQAEVWAEEWTGTLLEVVAAISTRLQESHRAVMAIRIDGTNVSPEDLRTHVGERSSAEVQRLEIESEPLHRLVEDSLRELDEHLPMLPQVCHKLAAVFQSENPEDGYAPFQQLAEIWHAVKVRQIQLANALDVRLDAEMIDGRTVMQATEELNQFLREAEEAIRAGDSVAIGDLLAYELAPRAELEAKIVAKLRERVPRAS